MWEIGQGMPCCAAFMSNAAQIQGLRCVHSASLAQEDVSEFMSVPLAEWLWGCSGSVLGHVIGMNAMLEMHLKNFMHIQVVMW